ncbi:MAG: FAD-dependent oxidoreductase [Gemmatimonadota bacterium]
MSNINGGTEILDVLVIGGGPAGTAAAFRARELRLEVLVIDFDDILKRIRDYPSDKLILPSFGGGDRMRFPAGGKMIAALQFGPIDKDEMCSSWKALYGAFGVPFRTGVELTAMERADDLWNVVAWDHKASEQVTFRARHVVVALGRGVPRRFDIPGNTDGIAYRLDEADRYAKGPVLVVGGGTSAAEAVLAISRAKVGAGDECPVYWAYRGTKMPRVSKALAEQFFEAYIGNGNIRHFPESEPVAVVTTPDRTEVLSLRVDRKTPAGRPPETLHLEFAKTQCIACIGEDIPEALLSTIGVDMVAGGTKGKKTMAVTPLLETQQPNVYVIGDLLSQSYLETDDFAGSPDTFRQVKHRGNIKSGLRDGVFVAEVINQRLEGRAEVNVVIRDAEPLAGDTTSDGRVSGVLGLRGDEEDAAAEADVTPEPGAAAAEGAYLVLLTPAGVEAEEFRLNPRGMTTLGRTGTDLAFPHDTLLSEAHASLTRRDSGYFLRDDGSRAGTYQKVLPDRAVSVRHSDLIRAGQQILVVSRQVRGAPPELVHYDARGRQVAVYLLKDTTVFGRSGGKSDPDVLLDNDDHTLSRFHFSLSVEDGEIQLHDFGSRNGTYLKIEGERQLGHRDVFRIGGQQLEVRLREDLPEKTTSMPAVAPPALEPPVAPTSSPPPPPAAKLEPPPAAAVQQQSHAAVAAPVASGPHVTFQGQELAGPLAEDQTLLEWADENEVDIDYECWIGMCGCDAIRILEGAEHLSEPAEKELKTLKRKGLEPGACRLACMARASGPVVVEVID